jgi:tripartite-type tricarboxylate transporter receptor subunit TctC
MAMMDAIAGNVQLITIGTGAALAQVHAGKLRALATLTADRVAPLPEVPTIAEAGFPGLEVQTWYAVFFPAKTPQPIVRRLNALLSKVMFEPGVSERLAGIGAEPLRSTPDELAKFTNVQIAMVFDPAKERIDELSRGGNK